MNMFIDLPDAFLVFLVVDIDRVASECVLLCVVLCSESCIIRVAFVVSLWGGKIDVGVWTS